ncbi:MAG: 4-hydroxy-tetrahydrodipicolinate reductase [Armatimonadetes bacterium]|nr:4-hydroxy-tetrahydrodipicolinate reductase [Armatimonadota bacterium]
MDENGIIKVAVIGAAGRMGQEVLRTVSQEPGIEIVVACDREHVGENCRDFAGGRAPDLIVSDKLGASLDNTKVDVLIDFSHASGAASHSESAVKRGISPIIGATGLSDSDSREIFLRCKETGVPGMYVPNFAIGAVLMMRFSEMAARWMPDCEIIELHHDRKEDAPSGTAMRTAEMIQEARQDSPTRKPRTAFKVEGVRGGTYKDVVLHSVRLPGLLAHQQVMFGRPGELLTIKHDSMDRTSFMQGVALAVREVRGLQGFVVGLDKILFR